VGRVRAATDGCEGRGARPGGSLRSRVQPRAYLTSLLGHDASIEASNRAFHPRQRTAQFPTQISNDDDETHAARASPAFHGRGRGTFNRFVGCCACNKGR
jgi:hypothetical protein